MKITKGRLNSMHEWLDENGPAMLAHITLSFTRHGERGGFTWNRELVHRCLALLEKHGRAKCAFTNETGIGRVGQKWAAK